MKPMIPAVLVLTLALTACTPTGEESRPSGTAALPYEEGQLYAAAWLGYQDMSALKEYVDSGLVDDSVPVLHVSDGDYYLILPREEGMALSILQNDISTSQSRLLYEDPDCGAIVIQCNVSDIFPDVTIRLSGERGETEFSPFISLKDGSVDIGPDGLNLTGD